MTKILVIDDEPDLVRFVRRALEAEGYQVLTSTNGLEGLRLALDQHPALIVLDLAMPGMHGEAVLSALVTQDPSYRVLILSATADVQLRIACLEQGAVDFVAKPFAVRELIARARGRLGEDAANRRKNRLRVGDIVLDLEARQLVVDGRPTLLAKREFLLLRHLMTNPDAVCSRQELLSEVWGYDFDPSTNVVDVCVGRLRSKVGPDLILTVRNVGYQLQSA
ncbi:MULTISPECIES: response regulator transcription factor [Kribbella]|uniref:DNA-binding response OmpR family regulator n=1 Tax=Kribbella pratensis TaxID=2512112 RepID=A0ABY2FRP3_9ACTN|nr:MULTISPECIES: response regulator transcription factor [Kribbella]TDW95454.1 DNA-binding response OmpR family regulator [Kribbella pratensis]TDX08462.1 DNA-binding response OmpR family regulator [Kribbella sp. VKM Ac-2566]